MAVGTLLIAEYHVASVLDLHERIQIVKSIHDVPGKVWDEAASSHITAGSLGELLTLLRQLGFNKIVETAGNPGTLELYADDGVTVLKTFTLTDAVGGAVTAQTGAPARRGAAT